MPICLALPPSDAKPRIMGGVGTRDFGVPRLCVFDSLGVGGWTGQPVLPTTAATPCIPPASVLGLLPLSLIGASVKSKLCGIGFFCDVFFGVL